MIVSKLVCDVCELPILPGEEYLRSELRLVTDDTRPGCSGVCLIASKQLDLHVACALKKGHVTIEDLHTLKGGRA